MLIINDLQGDDADEYSCRASNSLGSRSTKAQLSIRSKPRIFIPPRYHGGYEAQKGEQIEVKIPFKAFPAPHSRWTKNGEPITDSDKYTITTDDKYATFIYFALLIRLHESL